MSSSNMSSPRALRNSTNGQQGGASSPSSPLTRKSSSRMSNGGAASPATPRSPNNYSANRSRGGDGEDAYTRVQRLMAEAKNMNKEWKTGSPTFRSSTPRLTPTRTLPCDTMFNFDKDAAKAQKSGWGVSKVPQREGPRLATDKFYDPKHPDEINYVQRGTRSVPATPRMPPTPNNKVPVVGTYTSPYISCGMGM